MLRFFIAGIMQGSHSDCSLHSQDYRTRIDAVLAEHFPAAEIYDPFTNHQSSVEYDDETGRRVFLDHNKTCGEVDVVVAFVPEASMGTAIEMWEAFRHNRFVVAISPLLTNWSVKFLSNKVYPDVAAFEQAISSGELKRLISEHNENRQS